VTDRDSPLLQLLGPDPTRWLALAPTLRAAVLGQLEHHASQRVARDLGRLLVAPWWAALEHDDAIRAARVVAHVSASADGAPREPDEPCRRTILDHTLDSLLPPQGRFSLCFEELPLADGTVVAGLRLPPATVVLNRRAIAACDARLGAGPHGWLETRVGTATLVHEVNHLHNLVPAGPTYAAFQDEYRAWYVDFVVEAARPPRRVEALDRCRELLTSPAYAALGRAVADGSPHRARIFAFLRAFGPVQRLEELLALPREGWLDPAPLPRPRLNMTNAPTTAPAAMDGAAAAIAGSA
jgi:hypothetical protein